MALFNSDLHQLRCTDCQASPRACAKRSQQLIAPVEKALPGLQLRHLRTTVVLGLV
jgi:hypothetical protein